MKAKKIWFTSVQSYEWIIVGISQHADDESDARKKYILQRLDKSSSQETITRSKWNEFFLSFCYQLYEKSPLLKVTYVYRANHQRACISTIAFSPPDIFTRILLAPLHRSKTLHSLSFNMLSCRRICRPQDHLRVAEIEFSCKISLAALLKIQPTVRRDLNNIKKNSEKSKRE